MQVLLHAHPVTATTASRLLTVMKDRSALTEPVSKKQEETPVILEIQATQEILEIPATLETPVILEIVAIQVTVAIPATQHLILVIPTRVKEFL